MSAVGSHSENGRSNDPQRKRELFDAVVWEAVSLAKMGNVQYAAEKLKNDLRMYGMLKEGL